MSRQALFSNVRFCCLTFSLGQVRRQELEGAPRLGLLRVQLRRKPQPRVRHPRGQHPPLRRQDPIPRLELGHPERHPAAQVHQQGAVRSQLLQV